MAWTTPGTAVSGATYTAANYNAWVRDNLDALNPLDTVGATSWSPTMNGSSSNDTVGSMSGRYWRVGPLVYAAARWVSASGVGGGGPGGNFAVTLPINASGVTGSDAAANTGQVVGSFRVVDSGTSANNQGGQVVLSSNLQAVRFALAAGNLVSDSNPFTFAAGDVLAFFAVYPAA